MSISIRESIRWPPDPASEPTSTVVLTSPGRRFVDVRVLLPEEAGGSGSGLDWAFAGTSSSVEVGDGVWHTTWRHVVDSRTNAPASVVDEGDVLPRGDGVTLETGRMVNPATGRVAEYEEVWADLEPEAVPEAGRDSPSTGSIRGARYVVVELSDEARVERGMVVCLGRYCQGVVRVGDRFAAERWLWGDGTWQRKYRSGGQWIPGPEQMGRDTLSVGDEVGLPDALQRWAVVEVGYL
ncbi:putative sodium nucleoside [Rosellinia necatrix]|uniref:Protein HRI1 n=1 Tax=Rosellinia necatrix TaxID=77044 RepID=A0A1W2TMQ6_ROSNE|nr:putative sodium nucleoside [Rosellinia necatrix]